MPLWQRRRGTATIGLALAASPMQSGSMKSLWQDALKRAQAHSPFLEVALRRQPELAALLEQGDGEAALAATRQIAGKDADTATALRQERLALATALAIGDLAG